MNCAEIIRIFFQLTLTVKLYHWQTRSYSRHKATDKLFEKLTELTDQFIEVYIGKYGRPSFNDSLKLNIKEVSDQEAISMIKIFISFLANDIQKYLSSNDTDLYNIRDELLSNLNQTLYLFTLH